MIRWQFAIACTTALLLFYSSCSHAPEPSRSELPDFLPNPGEIESWEMTEQPRIFKGEDLWAYINGGAEIYHEYGFVQVTVQEFVKGEKSIVVEVFEMDDPTAAFGIYSFKIGRTGRDIPLLVGGRLEDYYLNFWKGKYAVTLTGFETDQDTISALEKLAQAIDAKITDSGDKPDLVNLLPKDGLEEANVKYFKGNLGMFNNYTFDASDLFQFREAVRGMYREGHDLYLLRYDTPDLCRQRFDEVQHSLAGNDNFKNLTPAEESFSIQDATGKALFLAPRGRHLCIVIGAPSTEAAQTIAGMVSTEGE